MKKTVANKRKATGDNLTPRKKTSHVMQQTDVLVSLLLDRQSCLCKVRDNG